MSQGSGRGRPRLHRSVTIVIVTWNGLAHTRRCLDSLLPTIRGLPAEVIVVDNGSTDGTVEFLRGTPAVRAVFQSENTGFSAGVNTGIRAAHPASDIVLLNNDVIVEDPNWLLGLAAVAHRYPATGVVSARLHYPDGRLQDAGTAMLFEPAAMRHYGIFEPEAGQYGTDRPVAAVSFAFAYVRREVIERIGLLDDARYFCYFEDIDFCLRAWEAGFSVWCAGGVRAAHVEHGSSREFVSQLAAVSGRAFYERWGAHLAPDPRRTVALRWPEGADWQRRELLRKLALGLEARGWRMVARRIQRDGVDLPIEECSSDHGFDDLWRVAAQRDAERDAASIELADRGRELRIAANGREEVWPLDDAAGSAGGTGPRFALAPDRDYFRPRARPAREDFVWLAILAGPRGEAAWSVLCTALRNLTRARCMRMESLAIPYDLRWANGVMVAQSRDGRLEVRRHCWADAVERVQLYAEVDACVLCAGPTDMSLAALELAAVGIPIAAIAADLPEELRSRQCAGLLPSGEAFPAALHDRFVKWTRDPAAARRTGHRAALAVGKRSWTHSLDELSARLEALVA